MRQAAIVAALLALVFSWIALNAYLGEAKGTPEASPSASRSYPPDKTNYRREAIPEDIRPGGKPAVGPNVVIKPQPTAVLNK